MRLRLPPMWLGVTDDGQVGKAAAQFDGNVPLRQVAVDALVVGAESTVYHTDFAYACIVDALHGTNPQFEVGVDRVFDEYGYVYTFQCVGDFLHRKGIGCRACSDPEYVYAVFEGFEHMVLVGHLGSYIHAGLFFDTFQPGKANGSHTFKSTRFGAGFPYSGPEYLYTLSCQFLGGFEYLLFGLGAARAGDDERTFVFDTRQGNRFEIHDRVCHSYMIFL